MSGKPILLPHRHKINIGLAIALVALILLFALTESGLWLLLLILISFTLGVTLIIPIGERICRLLFDAEFLFRSGLRQVSASRLAISH